LRSSCGVFLARSNVPVRIEEVIPAKSMEYFLGGIHWLDALTSPIEQHLTRLADTVNAILQVDVVGHAKADRSPRGTRYAATPVRKSSIRHTTKRLTRGKPIPNMLRGGGRPPRLPSPFAAFWLLAAFGFIKPARMLRRVRRQRPNPASCLASTLRNSCPRLCPSFPIVSARQFDHSICRHRITRHSPSAPVGSGSLPLKMIRKQPGQPHSIAARGRPKQSDQKTGANYTRSAIPLFFQAAIHQCQPAPWVIRNTAIETPFATNSLPLMNEAQRAYWEKIYPTAAMHKTLALSPGGAGSYYSKVHSSEEAVRRALELCTYNTGAACMIVAINYSFVVPIPTAMKATGFFTINGNASIAPELRNSLAQRMGNAMNAWNAVAVGVAGRPGLMLNAANEQAAIEGALTECSRQDHSCRVIALGPFAVEAANPPR
jgi:hypothetical protein